MHRGMLTDTATSERPGPWSEPVLLQNVERPSAVEQGGFKAAIARWRNMALPAADFVAVRMRLVTFRAVASYRNNSSDRLASHALHLWSLGWPCYNLAFLTFNKKVRISTTSPHQYQRSGVPESWNTWYCQPPCRSPCSTARLQVASHI